MSKQWRMKSGNQEAINLIGTASLKFQKLPICKEELDPHTQLSLSLSLLFEAFMLIAKKSALLH